MMVIEGSSTDDRGEIVTLLWEPLRCLTNYTNEAR
jgi:hypothetical protein